MPDAVCLLSFLGFLMFPTHSTHQFFFHTAQQKVCCPVVLLFATPPHAGQSWRRKGSKPTLVHKLWRRQYDVFPISIRNFTAPAERKQDRRARWPERVVRVFVFICHHVPTLEYWVGKNFSVPSLLFHVQNVHTKFAGGHLRAAWNRSGRSRERPDGLLG